MYLALFVILLHCASLKAQDNVFTINKVELTVPSNKVNNGESIQLTCTVDISKSVSFQMQHTFLFYKDDRLLYNITSLRVKERYKIFPARFADSGNYKCTVEANRKTKSSSDLEVQVKGLSQPKLTALKTEVTEGDVVSLRCEEPDEKPPFIFVFSKLLPNEQQQVKRKQELNTNFTTAEFPVEVGDLILRFQCTAKVNSAVYSETSEPSNVTLVTVVEQFSNPKLTVRSPRNITEGDRIDIECSTVVAQERPIEILIQKDKRILSSAQKPRVTYSAIATMENNGNYTCKVELGSVSKTSSLNVVVAELFAKPILTSSSTEVDENESLSLWCHINDYINDSSKANFSIIKRPPENGTLLKTSSNFTIKAQVNDSGSYVCRAKIKGITKESDPVRITVYAPVSNPDLSVDNSFTEVVLGKTLLLRCQSMFGTPPINYTLFRGNRRIHTITVFNNTYAEFKDIQTKFDDLGEYICEASNCHSHAKRRSQGLNITVIAPVRNVSLGSYPPAEVENGEEIVFFCSVSEGSLPVNFSIFKQNEQTPFFYESKMETKVLWRKILTKQDTGKYFCEASNRASRAVRSNLLNVKVILASWQKGLIAAIVLVLIALAACGFWWYLRKKEKDKHPTMEMSGSTAAMNSTNQKLVSGQNNDGEFYSGSAYIEDGENHVKATDENKDSGEHRHSRIEGSPDST
uniref:Platelet endothelial cell adhesion molecule n=1 Tax=Pelusios castaneus TaxID=367368 RepID=A0A8C8RDS0_9SAUR